MNSYVLLVVGGVLSAVLACLAGALMLATGAMPAEAEEGRPSVASWYGPGLYGNATASGDVCCPGYTAAHRELPFGTEATLRNPDDGSEVAIVVNDRGPSLPDREWDLSPAAADAIGVDDAGVMAVEVVAVN